MAPRTVGLIGAACLSAGWLVASLLTPPVARLQSLPERRGDAASRGDSASTAEPTPMLQLEWRRTEQPPVPRRNPFVFGRRGVAVPDGDIASGGSESAEPLAPPPPPRVTTPPYSLSGVAVTGDARTAVLSDGSTVHLVTVGQTIGGYSVVAVDDDAVTLTDAAGERFVLRLR
jgi:hypothetical protein